MSSRRTLDEALIGTGLPFLGKSGHAQALKELHQIMQRTVGIRRNGACSLDLAYVAAGQFDGYWERGIKPWDMAAGLLMVHEAGGKFASIDSDASPFETGTVICANLDLFPEFLEKVRLAK